MDAFITDPYFDAAHSTTEDICGHFTFANFRLWNFTKRKCDFRGNAIYNYFMFLPSGFRVFCFILVLVFLLCKTGLVHSLFLFSNWQTSYEAAVGMNGIGRVVARDTECNNYEPSLDSRVNVNRCLPVWKLVGSQHGILMKFMKTTLPFVILLKCQLICQCLDYIFIRKTIITYVATQNIVILVCFFPKKNNPPMQRYICTMYF